MTEQPPGVEAWKTHTTAFDRVHAVATTLSQPRPASYIAEQAHVAENTARDHLDRLVKLHILLKRADGDAAVYSPDPLHTRTQTLRVLLEEHDRHGLLKLKSELQAQIEHWQDEYGVASPEKLRTVAADTDTGSRTRELRNAASDWELARYRLSVLTDAIETHGTHTTN